MPDSGGTVLMSSFLQLLTGGPGHNASCERNQQSLLFLEPGTGFMEDCFSTDLGGEGWFGDASSALFLLYCCSYDRSQSEGGNSHDGEQL